ncbi:uncharacterized protein C05D11.1 [Lepeophtheirus salmonis]|uniref:uncharacterized protein C05D11.1 n=1 Tax=Lepeophtheirus salmonis TaxID=72036 RepID=UPI001AE7203D|nr:uncharacterized protein C05D11.1-like [Lepeophtheirus salmonis]
MMTLNSLLFCILSFIIVGKTHSASIQNGWELLDEFQLEEETKLQKYKSTRTNITVVISQVESPITNGYICLATEAFTNDGLPHTLEHLIFLGSEDYPYKELLDLLANRFFASRTNAFTETDHTCYTVFTAGSSGFLQILPIYLDHVLYPLLRDGDFLTEVHHINGDGEDAGVVYSEMQGIENLRSSLIYYPSLDALYPGNCSYEVTTGGKLKNLRDSTSMESIRDFHDKFYVSSNVYITITGSVSPQQVFEVLKPMEDKIVRKLKEKKGKINTFKRPFSNSIPPFTENKEMEINFPSDDEKLGYVILGWRLPAPINEKFYEINGWEIISTYLTSNSASPLIEEFVEIEKPLATNVDYELFDFKEPVIFMEFSSVPVEKMSQTEELFRKVLLKIVDAGPEGFDMNSMKTLIKRVLQRRLIKLENGPQTLIFDPTSNDQMYGEKKEDLRTFLSKGDSQWGSYFDSKNADFWIDIIKNMLNAPRLLVYGRPLSTYKDELAAKETARIKTQKKDLGEESLKEAKKSIEDAISQQTLPPESLLKSFPLGNVDSIKFRNLNYYNLSNGSPPSFNISAVPFKVHLDDVKSDVIRIYFVIDFSTITNPEDRALVPLLYELWTQLPITLENGTYLDLSELVRYRTETAIRFRNYFGNKGSTFRPGSQSENILFYIETLPEKYNASIQLLKDTLFRPKFTSERFKSVIQQILNGIPVKKSSPSKVLDAILDNIYFKDNTYIHHASFLRLQKTAVSLLNDLQKDETKILQKFKSLKDQVLHPKNIFLYVASNLEKNLDSGHLPWINFFGKGEEPPSSEFLSHRYQTPSENAFKKEKPDFRHAIASVSSSESCYLKQSIYYDNTDWEDNEIAALRIALKYLTDRMYNDIRGKGYTYSIGTFLSVTEGKITVKFSRSSLLPEGFKEFRNVVEKHLNASTWSEYLVDSARGSQIYSSSGSEETVSNLISSSFSSILRGAWDPLFNRRFVQRVGKVTFDEIRDSAIKYLPRFLDPNQTFTAIVCHSNDVDRVVQTLKEFNIEVKKIVDIENSLLSD